MSMFRVGVGMDIKKASNKRYMNKMLVAQSDR